VYGFARFLPLAAHWSLAVQVSLGVVVFFALCRLLRIEAFSEAMDSAARVFRGGSSPR
jgi:hypothetical protein